ncbi:MAG: uroporphyrinogen decarboxylase [Alphaproteobacteria bacterium]|nr:uroporphyrinogen decarboxylase [Alphaproteobacteria bacterium]
MEAKKVVRVLSGTRVSPPPVWLMRQAGRYLPEYRALRATAGSFWTMCMSPDLAAEITLQPIRRFGMDAAIVFSDILVVPYALGGEVRFEEGVGPLLTRYDAIDKIERDPQIWLRKLAPVYETLRQVRADLDEDKTLLGFAGAPWTLATYLAEGGSSSDQRAARLWGYGDRDGFSALLDLLSDCVACHLIAQLKAGADAVQIFDSWASGLSPECFEDWVIAPTQRVVSKVRAAVPGAKIIGFPRGATLEGYRRYGQVCRVDALSLDTAVPMDWAVTHLAPLCAVQGNLDPLLLLAGGEGLRRKVRQIVETASDVPFVFNLGHGVVPQTPPEHVAAVLDAVRTPI